MFGYFSENGSQILDGLLFGLGVLAVYLGAVITGALIRSLGGAGSAGLTMAGRYMQGWFDYLRGDDRNTINVTLNMIVDDHLKFDTLVADRRLWYVWPNSYRVLMIRRAARHAGSSACDRRSARRTRFCGPPPKCRTSADCPRSC